MAFYYDPFSSPFIRKSPQYRSRPRFSNDPNEFINPFFQRPQPQANPFSSVNYRPEPEGYSGEVDDYMRPTETYGFSHPSRVPHQKRNNNSTNIKKQRQSQNNINTSNKSQKQEQHVPPTHEEPEENENPQPSIIKIPVEDQVVEPKVTTNSTSKPVRIIIGETLEEKQQKLEKLRQEAAQRIQRWYSGASIRKLDIIPKLKRLAAIKQQVNKLYSDFSDKIFNTPTPLRHDVLLLEELLIQKMLTLDGVTSQSDSVRERRRALTKHINKLLDQIEIIKTKLRENVIKSDKEQATENSSVNNIQPIVEEKVNQENSVSDLHEEKNTKFRH